MQEAQLRKALREASTKNMAQEAHTSCENLCGKEDGGGYKPPALQHKITITVPSLGEGQQNGAAGQSTENKTNLSQPKLRESGGRPKAMALCHDRTFCLALTGLLTWPVRKVPSPGLLLPGHHRLWSEGRAVDTTAYQPSDEYPEEDTQIWPETKC